MFGENTNPSQSRNTTPSHSRNTTPSPTPRSTSNKPSEDIFRTPDPPPSASHQDCPPSHDTPNTRKSRESCKLKGQELIDHVTKGHKVIDEGSRSRSSSKERSSTKKK